MLLHSMQKQKSRASLRLVHPQQHSLFGCGRHGPPSAEQSTKHPQLVVTGTPVSGVSLCCGSGDNGGVVDIYASVSGGFGRAKPKGVPKGFKGLIFSFSKGVIGTGSVTRSIF